MFQFATTTRALSAVQLPKKCTLVARPLRMRHVRGSGTRDGFVGTMQNT